MPLVLTPSPAPPDLTLGTQAEPIPIFDPAIFDPAIFGGVTNIVVVNPLPELVLTPNTVPA